MDKYEFNIKVEQIKKLVGKNDYETAMKIADTIDWRRVRNTNLLSMVAMVYEKNKEYQEAKEILLQAYERAPIGKRLLYKLAELAIKEGNIEEAEAYYKEFGDLASEDPRQQLLRYMILRAKGAPAQQLIHSLESYTSVELDEKWLYELAELYSLAGMPERCVETCDRIMLMFGLGKYVDKAMDLKVKYAPLTRYQMDLVENRDKYEARLRAVEQRYGNGGVPVEEGEEEYYREEPAPQQEPEFIYQENSVTSNLEASIQEAAVQETLARELSKISYDEPAPQPEMKLEHTRVLEDIRRVGRPMTSVKTPGGAYFAQAQEPVEFNSEPVIEEDFSDSALNGSGISSYNIEEPDIYPYGKEEYENSQFAPEDSGTSQYDNEDPELFQYAAEESGIHQYGTEESETSQYDVEESDYSYYGEEGIYEENEGDYENREYAVEQSAVTAEGEEDSASDSSDYLQFEDLYDEEEEDEPDDTPVRNHLMIEARTPEKGLSMAVEALKQIHKENGVNNPVAKITGSKLSKRGVLASAEKLAGKDLVIEEAGDLTPEALVELNQIMSQDTSGMIVVLIDNPKQMEALHREHPALASKFECIGSGEMTQSSVAQRPAYQPRILKEQSQSYQASSCHKEAVAYGERNLFSRNAEEEEHHLENNYQDEDSYQPQDNYQEEYSYEEESDYLPEEGYDAQEPIKEKPAPRKKFFSRSKKDSYREPYSQEDSQAVGEEAASYDSNEEMDIDEFAQYACRYANEIDCSITGKSMLALYERIEIMEEDGIPLSRSTAESLIEEAADRAERPSFGKRIKNLFSSKYDKDGLLVLKEEHFIY